MIRGIKKNGATPLDGYDFGYGGTGNRRYVWGLDLSGGEACAGGVLGWVASVRPGAPAGALWEHLVVDGSELGRKAGKCRPARVRAVWGGDPAAGRGSAAVPVFNQVPRRGNGPLALRVLRPPLGPLAEQRSHRRTRRGESVWVRGE